MTAAQDHVCGPDCQCGCEAGLTIPVRRPSTAASPLYEEGVRVILCGDHSLAGKEGTLVARASETFKVWAVRLDDGCDTGANESQMVSERA